MRDELVRRAQRGDHEAFCAIAQDVIARLRGTARLILRDAARADDAVQEALVAAWQHLPDLRDPARLEPWLNRLLVRACYRHHRRDHRRQLVEIPLPADRDWPVPDGLASVAQRDQLERAFRRLTPEQRAVLTLTYYADLPLGDVAEALGVPFGTARSRLYRALDAMRASLIADERQPALVGGRTA